MAFPSPASNGQLYESNGTTYVFLSQYNLWQKYSVTSTSSSSTTNTATINVANVNTSTTNTAIINTANVNTSTTNTAIINTANVVSSTTNTAVINVANVNTSTTNTAVINTANVGSIAVTGGATFNNIQVSAIYANGSYGTPGQVLFTNGTQDYWGNINTITGYTGSKGNQGIVGYTGSLGSSGFTGSIGYAGSQGSSGFAGSQGYAGSTGNQGTAGYTGSQGPLGYSGSQGNKGDSGYTGSQGPSGYTGSFGSTGYTGSFGSTGFTGSFGSTGFTGSQGIQGYQGNQGAPGPTGYTGSQGDKGDTGYVGSTGFVGSQGPQGSFGGETVNYKYSSSITNADPGAGYIRFNSSDLTLATFLYINQNDINSSNAYNFLYTIDQSSSSIKGHFKVQDISNSQIFTMYAIIGSHSYSAPYLSIPVAYVSGTDTLTNNENVILTFAVTGDRGDQGYTGSQGTTGFVGSQGVIGYSGSKGVDGYSGSKGNIGYSGSAGLNGNDGYTGSKGDQGTSGYTGSIGPQGNNGYTGSLGYTGSTGSQGVSGYTGSKGDQGTTGYAGSQGPQGYWGSTGFVGSQGNYGYTGSKGDQGTTGYAGSLGYTGSFGNTGYTGSTGFVGSQGIRGVSGYTGSTGDQGTTGYAGSLGYTGSFGSTGYVGSQGVIGYSGSLGYTGSLGQTGYTGSVGSTGYTGSVGSQGTTGYTGSKGDQGNTGYAGSQGVQGIIGYSGSQGVIGYTGSIGIGYAGSTGYVGSKGDVQPANVVFGDTPPSSPYTGLLWFDTNNAIFNAYYEPANNWIGINGGGFGPTGYTGSTGAYAAIGYTGSQGIQANLLAVPSNIIPNQTNTYSLGNSTFTWSEIHVGSNSIIFTDSILSSTQVLSVANNIFYITSQSGANLQFNANAGFNAGGIILQNYQVKLANTQQLLYFNANMGIGNAVANSAQTAFFVSNTGLTTIQNNLQIINPIAQTNTAPFTIQSQLGTPQPFSYTGTTIYTINSANLSNRSVYDAYGNGVYVSIAARTSRGTISNPTGLQANDVILRISGNGYRNSGFGTQGSARIDFRSIDSFSDVQNGTQIDFWTTPLGSNVISQVATVTAIGITSNSFTAGFGTSNSTVNSIAVSTNTVFTNNISANGSLGSPKQVLMSSDATGNVYWQWTKQHFALGANLSLNATSTSAQSLFGVGVQVANNSRYAISMRGSMTYTGGGPAGGGNIGFGFGGTANLASVYYQTSTLVNANETVSGQAPDYQAFRLTSGFTANSSTNPVTNFNKSYLVFNLEGIINVANGGTLIPQYDTDHASTTLTLLALSSVSLELLGDDSKANSVTGTWA